MTKTAWLMTPLAGLVACTTAQGPAPTLPRVPLATDESKSCAAPVYPPELRAAQATGTVVVRYRMSAEGRIDDVRVLRSSGHAMLDEATRQAITDCIGRPGTRNGRPVESTGQLEFVFRLE